MTEAEFRLKVKGVFQQIEASLEREDPDAIEADNSQGSLVLTLAGKTKIILSQQPSVSQLWVAVASQGKAGHFEWNATANEWRNLKDLSESVFSFVENAIEKSLGRRICLK